MTDWKLNAVERDSALWRKLTEYLNYRIEVARRKNDGDLDQFATARLRGAIAELKSLVELGEDRPPIGADDQ